MTDLVDVTQHIENPAAGFLVDTGHHAIPVNHEAWRG